MLYTKQNNISSSPRYLTILFLPLLFFISAFLAYLEYFSLKIEIHTLIILAFILLVFIFFIKHNAWYSFCKFKNSFEEILSSIEEHLDKNKLSINNQTKSFGDIEVFFDDYVKQIRNDNFASVAASVFPTLGILGTFIAIALSMPDFSVQSQADLDKEITILLSGVGTAFYASIYGIFLSLLWIFFEKRGLSKIQSNIFNEMQTYKNRMWTTEEISLLNIIENQNNTKQLSDKLQIVMSSSYVEQLDKISNEKLNTIESLNKEHEKLEKLLFTRYTNIIDLFEQSSKKQDLMINSFEKLHTQIMKNSNQSSKSFEDYVKHSTALKAEIYTVLSSFQLISSDLRTFGQDLIQDNLNKSIKDEQQ